MQGLPPAGYRDLTTILDQNESDFAKACDGRRVAAGHLRRRISQADQIGAFVSWGLKRGNVRFAFLGDHANSRGAADMGLLPDLLPGYVPVAEPGAFARNMPACPRPPG